jgi:glycosyltransferase involved in cell wall biosynthesis
MFIIHNVLPHERMPCERLITAFTLKRGDFHLIQSEQSVAPLLELLQRPVYRKALLPAHHVATDDVISREEARRRISVPPAAKVLLFFGFVRDYKGLLYLLEALPAIRAALPDARLLIAGEFHDDKAAYQQKIAESGVADMVDLHDGYIPGGSIYQYFRAADLAVLPYTSATQSGIVQIAFGFGTPVVVTSVGGLPEVVADGRTGFIVPPKDAKALADAVIRFFVEDKRDQFSAAIEHDQGRFSWRRMVETIEEMVATSNRPE